MSGAGDLGSWWTPYSRHDEVNEAETAIERDD